VTFLHFSFFRCQVGSIFLFLLRVAQIYLVQEEKENFCFVSRCECPAATLLLLRRFLHLLLLRRLQLRSCYRLMHSGRSSGHPCALNGPILQGHTCLLNKVSYLRCGLVSPPVAVVLVAFISIIVERTRLLW